MSIVAIFTAMVTASLSASFRNKFVIHGSVVSIGLRFGIFRTESYINDILLGIGQVHIKLSLIKHRMEKGMISFQFFILYWSTYSSILTKYPSSTFIVKSNQFLSVFTTFITKFTLLHTAHYRHIRFHIQTYIFVVVFSLFTIFTMFFSIFTIHILPVSPTVHCHYIHFRIHSVSVYIRRGLLRINHILLHVHHCYLQIHPHCSRYIVTIFISIFILLLALYICHGLHVHHILPHIHHIALCI